MIKPFLYHLLSGFWESMQNVIIKNNLEEYILLI